MSEVKVNKISPRTNCGTVTLGDSGDTFTIPSGATITNNGTQTGFGRTGTVDWVTTPKVTGDSPVTAATGSGYFLNTTAGTITINLPAGAAGSIVSMADYAATWQTYNVTVSPNGTDKIGSLNQNATLSTEGQSVTFVYVDSTQGWINTMDSTSNVRGQPPFIAATGGTPACGTISGDYKYHKFTGPGTFCVTRVSPSAPQNVVSYMVIAGGGGGGGAQGGAGGGAGGFREYKNSCDPYTASPLDGNPCGTAITVSATAYPIVVGGGGDGGVPGADPTQRGQNGNPSTFSTITSTAGGGGGAHSYPNPGQTGGSGGGGGGRFNTAGGAGNTPSTTPAQGTAGGNSAPGPVGSVDAGGGGGGATVAGVNASDCTATAGGAGATTSITATPTAYAGGGGGGNESTNGPAPGGAGNPGGSGGKGPSTAGGCGTVNAGGGGGGSGENTPGDGGAGGSGVVVIRYKFQ